MSKIFLPSDRVRSSDHIFRVGAALVRSTRLKIGAEQALRELGYTDATTAVILKAATSPATMSDPDWAGALAVNVVADFITSLTPVSAAAALLAAGVKVSLAGKRSVSVPSMIIDAADAAQFIGEGMSIPVRGHLVLSGPTVGPAKLGMISTYSRELSESSSIAAVARQHMTEAGKIGLDLALFSADPGDETTPPGLLLGAPAPIAGTAGGGLNAIAGDVKLAVQALSDAGSASSPAFVLSPGSAAAMKTLVGPRFDYPIYATSAVAPDTMLAIEQSGIVSGFDPVPLIVASKDTTIISMTDPPNDGTLANPTHNIFQQDLLALRMTLWCGWNMRAPGLVQTISPITW